MHTEFVGRSNSAPSRAPKPRDPDAEFKVFDARPARAAAQPDVHEAQTSVAREAETALREMEMQQEVPLLRQFAILARMLTYGDMSDLCVGITGDTGNKADELAASIDKWSKEFLAPPPMPEEP
jgi:hypothetical protein